MVVAQGEVRVDQLGRHLSRYEGQKVFLAMEVAREKQVSQKHFRVFLPAIKLMRALLISGWRDLLGRLCFQGSSPRSQFGGETTKL